jgi:acyl-CoA synthetase (NDP forming)
MRGVDRGGDRLQEEALALDFMFHPRSVAVAGASSGGGFGTVFLASLQAFKFPGPIYPVNPKAQEIGGLTCYASLRDVPGDVDYVISSVPASAVPQLLEDSAAKGVKAIHFFTAGFSETGEEERVELEQQVIQRARELGIRIIGPNCMGLYVPASHLAFFPDFPKEAGRVAMISQSGANATEFVHRAGVRGLRFSKVISYGNAADLDESDFFQYCAADPETDIITSYIEGIKDGRRFLDALTEAAAAKPVAILKGGRTEAGGRAANSHTGALAGSLDIFDAACRQAGAMRVDDLEELADVALVLRFVGVVPGPGVGIVGAGGGHSVLAADQVVSAGLRVPNLPEETQERLKEFTPLAGTSVRNPIDTNVAWTARNGMALLMETVRLMAEAPNIDVVAFHITLDWGAMRRYEDAKEHIAEVTQAMAEVLPVLSKPLIVVTRPPIRAEGLALTNAFIEKCYGLGVATFFTISRAARALNQVLAWQASREGPAGTDLPAEAPGRRA